MSTIDLAPLRADEALDLARQYVERQRARCPTLRRASRGNPLFLVQLLRAAEESSEESIPGSVQNLVLARVDRLPAEDRQAIQTASIFGQQLSLAALRRCSEIRGIAATS